MKNSNLLGNAQPTVKISIADLCAPERDRLQFQPETVASFDLTAEKIAIFATNEYEGFSRNGGIGTYYTTLSRKLHAEGWYTILLLCHSDELHHGQPHPPSLDRVFSTGELDRHLALQPIHHAILDRSRQGSNREFDLESWRCLFFVQAIAATFPDAIVYVEFPAIWGFGHRTIQAKRAGVLPHACFTGVTDHGGFEWLRETNQRYMTDDPRWFQQAYHVEQDAYDHADLTCFPSYFLRDKNTGYGWQTDRAQHLPYFIPRVTTDTPLPEVAREIAAEIGDRIGIVFFGRLEERKGLCTFIEALQTDLASTSPSGERPFVLFLGKIVTLESTALRGLDSQEYIDRALTDCLDYRIESNLSSAEAIAMILHLNAPIVCLCSLQENFPNTALEMGQLPLSLIAADTGGFRETLDLLKRTDGVHWFTPGDRYSLAATLREAIATRPETPDVPTTTDLDATDAQLLNRRLELMTDAFLANAPKDLPTPRVTVGIPAIAELDKLADCLESLTLQTYSDLEVIVLYDAHAEAKTQAAIAQARDRFPDYQFVSTAIGDTLGCAYNTLIERATGEYFLPLTLDRLLFTEAIATFVTAAGEAQANIVTCPDMTLDNDDLEVITAIDGSLLKLLEFSETRDLCALFSLEWLRSLLYCEERELRAVNWHLLAAGIATGEAIAHYPYPLYLSDRHSSLCIPSEAIPRERYYLRHSLSQIEPSRWTKRQLHLLLTCIEQLWQAESMSQQKLWQAERSQNYSEAQAAQAQAWMQTALQAQRELNDAQAKLQRLNARVESNT
jgi:glycosyltransferase involved in cell wall biosynthesis